MKCVATLPHWRATSFFMTKRVSRVARVTRQLKETDMPDVLRFAQVPASPETATLTEALHPRPIDPRDHAELKALFDHSVKHNCVYALEDAMTWWLAKTIALFDAPYVFGSIRENSLSVCRESQKLGKRTPTR
jgi:hypothetical protein